MQAETSLFTQPNQVTLSEPTRLASAKITDMWLKVCNSAANSLISFGEKKIVNSKTAWTDRQTGRLV